MTRKKFTKQFKLEAVRAMERGDTSPADLARQLGIRRNQLYKWQREVRLKGGQAFPGKRGGGVEGLTEVEQLRRRVATLEEENKILKKAESYFTARQK
jgi:transposase